MWKIKGLGIILAMIVTGGCAGSLNCTWESEEEQMQRILHEVEHLIRPEVKDETP